MTKTQMFLHGLDSSSQGAKASWFAEHFPEMRIHDYSGDLNERMAQLEEQCHNLQNLVLVGSSFGGLMAVCYCIRHPERCHSLILLAPALNFADFVAPQCKLETPALVVIGQRDIVTPPDLVLPQVEKTFIAPDVRLVDDDHMLQSTFIRMNWWGLLRC